MEPEDSLPRCNSPAAFSVLNQINSVIAQIPLYEDPS